MEGKFVPVSAFLVIGPRPNCKGVRGYTHSLRDGKGGKSVSGILQNVCLICFAGECARESKGRGEGSVLILL